MSLKFRSRKVASFQISVPDFLLDGLPNLVDAIAELLQIFTVLPQLKFNNSKFWKNKFNFSKKKNVLNLFFKEKSRTISVAMRPALSLRYSSTVQSDSFFRSSSTKGQKRVCSMCSFLKHHFYIQVSPHEILPILERFIFESFVYPRKIINYGENSFRKILESKFLRSCWLNSASVPNWRIVFNLISLKIIF